MKRLLLAAFVVVAIARPAAHEIPADVTVHMFVKPEGDRVTLLVRVPMAAMRDIHFPERSPGLLDLEKTQPLLRDAAKMWIADSLEVFENDLRAGPPRLTATRVSLPSDPSFASFDRALANVMGPPLGTGVELNAGQAVIDVLLEYPIGSASSRFSIRPEFARLGLRVVTVMRFLPPTGGVRAFEYRGDPGLVRLDPRWHQAALQFVGLGFRHILGGIDHLLFLCCLVIPFRRLGQLVVIVTSFTVAHSITLIAAAMNAGPDGLWFPPLIETLIATSIVYMALENVVGVKSVRRRWMITFAFGLVHGFGFSFALRETLQFAGSHLLTSLVAFNVGVELGQLLVLIVMIPVLQAVFRWVVAERIGTIILSALIAHTAWHWMLDRGETLLQYRWPAPDVAVLLTVVRWLMIVVVAAGIWWFVRQKRPYVARTEDRT